MSASHDVEFRVRYAEPDQMGIVHHTSYLVWCEVGRAELIRVVAGVSYADIEAEGVALAVSELSVRYLGAARYDNLVRVSTSLTEARSRSVTFDYVITNAETGVRLATARTVLVSLDKQGRPAVMPERLREKMAR